MQPGADALGLPWRTYGQLAQPHQPLRAGALGDLIDQAGAEPVLRAAWEGVAEAHRGAARVGDDQGEAGVLEVAFDLAAQGGYGQAQRLRTRVVDAFRVGVGPNLGEHVEHRRHLAGPVGADHHVDAGTRGGHRLLLADTGDGAVLLQPVSDRRDGGVPLERALDVVQLLE